MASRVVWALLAVVAAGLSLQPAHAQGYVQSFFGPNSPPRLHARPGRYKPYPSYASARDQGRPATYRTLCVRLCDGYYFPLSFSTTRSEFADHADTCLASCGSEARLFYHPNPGGDVESMVDLTGMAYAELPNAFRYRRSLVDGCTCRPEPWTEAELERHRAYARGQQPAQPTIAAGTRTDSGLAHAEPSEGPDRSGFAVFDAPRAVERPRPISRYKLPSLPLGNGNGQATPFSPQRGSPAGYFR